MNTRLTPFLLLLALVHNVGANDDGNKPQIIRSYLSQLPEDSALREASETTPRRRCFLLSDSKEQEALKFLERVCKTCYAIDENGVKYVGGENEYPYRRYVKVTADAKSIKGAIRIILQNKPDELKWQEYSHVLQLAQKLNAEREQQLKEERQRQEEERQRQEEEKKKEFFLIERERPF